MKKFFMNPFAKIGMKGHNICRMITFALLAFTLGACSDDDDDITIEFPQQQELTCNAGETADLTFKATTDWQLTSSATWCKFLVNDVEEFATSGAAGEQSITIKAGTEAFGHEISTANITMTMGDRKAVIAKVSRSAKGYELKIYNEEGKELNSLEVGYDKFSKFVVKANFRFAATNRPNWVELEGGSMVGSADNATTGGLRIVQNGIAEKYPVTVEDKQMIEFADENGKASFKFPLTFKGMDEEEILVTGVNENPYDWTVSLDGKTFIQESTGGLTGETAKTTYKYRLPFTIKALNDDFEILYLEKYTLEGATLYKSSTAGEVDWMSFDYKTSTLSVSASYVEEREGLVFALPRTVYDRVAEDIWSSEFFEFDMETSTKDIAYKFLQNNLLIDFVQKDKKEETGPSSEIKARVTYKSTDPMNPSIKEAELTKVTEPGIVQDYGTETDIYSVDMSLGESFDIDPMIDEEWFFQAFIGDMEVTDKLLREEGGKTVNVWFSDEPDGIQLKPGQRLDVIFKLSDSWMNERVIIFQ